jgi:hypothetical protein
MSPLLSVASSILRIGAVVTEAQVEVQRKVPLTDTAGVYRPFEEHFKRYVL